MKNKALERDETSSLTNQLVHLSSRVNPAMTEGKGKTHGRARPAGEMPSSPDLGVEKVALRKAVNGSKTQKFGCFPALWGVCGCTFPNVAVTRPCRAADEHPFLSLGLSCGKLSVLVLGQNRIDALWNLPRVWQSKCWICPRWLGRQLAVILGSL